MPVQITINGADAAESIRELSALASGLTGAAPVVTPVGEPKKETKKTVKQEKPEPDSVKEEAPAGDPAIEESDDIDSADIPTDVELRAKAQEIGKKMGAEGKQAIKELLNEFGSPNITGIPEKRRIEFMARLEALCQ